MTVYTPDTSMIHQGKPFAPAPITNALLKLEKAIDGTVDSSNFEEDGVLGLRSFHDRSLSATFRSRKLIWDEEAIWVFQYRGGSTTNTFEHLGLHNNIFYVEEAATRVVVPKSCKVYVTAQIQVDAIKYTGLDQTSVTTANALSLVTHGGGSFAPGDHPGLALTFKLKYDDVGQGATVGTTLDERTVKRRMVLTSDLAYTKARQESRRGFTVNLCAVDTLGVPVDKDRIGGARDYWVEVGASFVEDESLEPDEVAFVTVRSRARHLTATTYSATGLFAASSAIAAPG